ncbi:uncharacterized protein [Arachis hypogaea]|uniref:uncharacterized protein n=1 Tax=Arachis hypogaea TaxID=3818 RepID=UPI003B21E6DB
MPYSEVSDVCHFQNKLIEEELAYDTNELTHTNLYTEQKMTHEQRLVFDEILNAVITDSGGFYFVYGHRGCGKAFIWNELSFAIRSREKVVLNVASSGIASLLLPGGRTDNSRFVNWILDVRNENIGFVVGDESEVNIPNNLLITTVDDPSLIWHFQSRAILAPTLESIEKVNDFVLTIFQGMKKEHLSSETTCQPDENEDVQ